MADSGSKGSSGKSSHPSPGGRSRTAKPAKTGGEPETAVKMGWLALRYDLGATYNLGGATFDLPVVTKKLHDIGAPEGDNVLFVPCPEELALGLGEVHPASCKAVKGKLAALHLHEDGEGNNQQLLYDYLDAHPPRSAEVPPGDWSKPLSLPKA